MTRKYQHIHMQTIADKLEEAICTAEDSPVACVNQLWRLGALLPHFDENAELEFLACKEAYHNARLELQTASDQSKKHLAEVRSLKAAAKGLLKASKGRSEKRLIAAQQQVEALITRMEEEDR